MLLVDEVFRIKELTSFFQKDVSSFDGISVGVKHPPVVVLYIYHRRVFLLFLMGLHDFALSAYFQMNVRASPKLSRPSKFRCRSAS